MPMCYATRSLLLRRTWPLFSVVGLALSVLALTAGAEAVGPQNMRSPGDQFELPPLETGAGAPEIFEHSREAGPDETFFLVGRNLTDDVFAWGTSPDNPGGGPLKLEVQLVSDNYLAATLPERAYDGPTVVAVKNDAGYSRPIVLNAPEPWWCGPATAGPGESVRVFGRNLSARPDGRRAMAYLAADGQKGRWIEASEPGEYAIRFNVPNDIVPGKYEVWLHAGRGGSWGWGGPVSLIIEEPPKHAVVQSLELPLAGPTAIQEALDARAGQGGGVVRLPAGTFRFQGTLRIPAAVTLAGAGAASTRLQLETSPPVALHRFAISGWGQAPGAIHTPGDTMTYELNVPNSGRWSVWLRYATEMSPWKLPGVSGNMAIQIDGGDPIPLGDLPNTGGFGTFRWSKSAQLDLPAGQHTLIWRNVKGGGLTLDAFVFLLDPEAEPSDAPLPETGSEQIVIQGEDCIKFVSKDGRLPGSDRAAVWLSGSGASVADLTILGNTQVNQGIAIRAPQPTAWLDGCRVERVTVADCEGKQAENCGIFVHNLRRGAVCDNEIWGRAPLFLSGTRQSTYAGNQLVAVTRFGGNAEAAILGRNEPIEECIVENNIVACPPGAEAGGPTVRRLIWVSTGHGSITHNWFARNGVAAPQAAGASTAAGQARFGGVAGTDQNVGESILFEGNHRTMYFGPLVAADLSSVTLPETVPATPDGRLGSVKREQLAHNDQGEETPFWPPDSDDGTGEPPIGEYYVSIFAGPGQGQTRRVTGREETRLLVDRPWRVAPEPGSVVAVGTAFYQNLIVENYTPDGMTGIQLWISCVENVISGNTIARQRKPGMYLYSNGTTLASSMPRTWNRGISPLFWNVAEGNRTDQCGDGALVTSGDAADLPVEFPRALGNVLRHNSFVRSRGNGVVIVSRKRATKDVDRSASIVGTIAEFNVVRDTKVAYHAGEHSDMVVFRRNHAYAWYPVDNENSPPVAFQVDDPTTRIAIEANSVEGKSGVMSATVVDLKESWKDQ